VVGNDNMGRTRRQGRGSRDDSMTARRLQGGLDDGMGSREIFGGKFGSLTA
jgi:hypothetical protein